ncbi:MAG: 23S rRNA (adenine(2503)-C(2))-methyltransferase RlmN, partial [Asticcacaulis sp.]
MAHTLDLSAKPVAPPAPVNITGLTREGLTQALIASGVVEERKARMRMQQMWRWMHHYGVTDFDLMTDIAKDQRALFHDKFTLARPEVVERQV